MRKVKLFIKTAFIIISGLSLWVMMMAVGAVCSAISVFKKG